MKSVVLGAVVVLGTCGTSVAGPVLLTSLAMRKDAAISGTNLNIEPRVEFILRSSSESFGSWVDVGRGISWSNGDDGSVDLSANTHASFTEFSSLLTNGVNDYFSQGTVFSEGSGAFGFGPESELLGTNPDFFGYDLEFVRLTVADLLIEPYQGQQFPQISGISVTALVTYDFYGSPVPEPFTIVLLGAGMVFAILGRSARLQH